MIKFNLLFRLLIIVIYDLWEVTRLQQWINNNFSTFTTTTNIFVYYYKS